MMRLHSVNHHFFKTKNESIKIKFFSQKQTLNRSIFIIIIKIRKISLKTKSSINK